MKRKYWIAILLILAISGITYFAVKKYAFKSDIGKEIDSFHGVKVYYNGWVSNVSGRNTSADGYNIGLKYQCVEFIKRYYYEYLNHKMPDSYGNAKDFFNANLSDGEKNTQRDLYQYSNPSMSQPAMNDILIFSGTLFNRYGHVAIISDVDSDSIEIIQQNPGPFAASRVKYELIKENDLWKINHSNAKGWLRKQ